MDQAREIDTVENELEFSVCTLVTRKRDYQAMLDSFRSRGFREPGTEFLFADNSHGNKYDAYQAINRFLIRARGRYVIVCHQDVRLLQDGADELRARLGEVAEIDDSWALVGNAGGANLDRVVMRITDPWSDNVHIGDLPEKVTTLDENFLVARRSANLAASGDIVGFHLYATDLCLIADILGYSAYVVDFHILHQGAGSASKFMETQSALIRKYARALRPRFLRTTCTKLYVSGSGVGSKLYNRRWAYRLARRWAALKSK